MQKILKIISKIAFNEAKKNANSTCWGPLFQPKSPKGLDKLKTK